MNSLIGLLRVDSYFLSPNSRFYKKDRLDTFMQKARNRTTKSKKEPTSEPC